jgi:O-antigen ligase
VTTVEAAAVLQPRRRIEASTAGVWFVTRALFLLFLMSIPFETVNIGMTGRVTIAKLLGYLFFMFALLQPGKTLRRRPFALWCFGLYVLILMCWLPFQNEDMRALSVTRIISLVQMLALFWIVANLCRDVRLARQALLAVSLSCTVLALLQVRGIGTTIETVGYTGERVSMLGENLNTLGAVYAIGAVILIGFAYSRTDVPVHWRWSMAGVSALIIVQLVRTGSRGAMLAMMGGLLTLALAKASIKTRIKIIVAIGAALAVGIWYSVTSELVRDRWEQTTKLGSMAEREFIFPKAWEMFLERPVAGWGPEAHYFELGYRLGKLTKETHNLYLWVLVETGWVGAIPHFVAIVSCVLMAWRARRTPHGITPYALCVTILIVNLSNTFHNRKLHWIILAYGVAAGTSVAYAAAMRVRRSRHGLVSNATPPHTSDR